MQAHEFHHKYANLPINDRNLPINTEKYGAITMNDVYIEVKRAQDNLRSHLEIADDFFRNRV